jgi:hypothetical protein
MALPLPKRRLPGQLSPEQNGTTNISCTDGTVSHTGCCLSDPQRGRISLNAKDSSFKWSNPSQPSQFFPS